MMSLLLQLSNINTYKIHHYRSLKYVYVQEKDSTLQRWRGILECRYLLLVRSVKWYSMLAYKVHVSISAELTALCLDWNPSKPSVPQLSYFSKTSRNKIIHNDVLNANSLSGNNLDFSNGYPIWHINVLFL